MRYRLNQRLSDQWHTGDKMGSSIVILLLLLFPFCGLFVLGIDIDSEHILTVCDTDNILHIRKGELIPKCSSLPPPPPDEFFSHLKRNSKWRHDGQSGGKWRRYSSGSSMQSKPKWRILWTSS